MRGRFVRRKEKKYWANFIYERLKFVCEYCGRVSHRSRLCDQFVAGVSVVRYDDKMLADASSKGRKKTKSNRSPQFREGSSRGESGSALPTDVPREQVQRDGCESLSAERGVPDRRGVDNRLSSMREVGSGSDNLMVLVPVPSPKEVQTREVEANSILN
ncbi:hypothetical protein Sjap_026410 [Stephania japonica]|uniref:Zinc knuckle CX2CX4HX4C domain-containing protein n=1 Tax=Stephania japonica TaxID=461633 RepID=A0AAP0E3N9_9MAGN